MAVKIVIADDHRIFRQGLARIISDENGFEVVGEASNGKEALDLILGKGPDITVLDLSMPGIDGLEVAREVHRNKIKTKLIFLTMHSEESCLDDALSLGVKGYVLKDNSGEDMVQALHAVSNGRVYISPLMSEYMIRRRKNNIALEKENSGLALLSAQEKRVLKNLSLNMTSREIADDLCISIRTVEHHRANIAQKLNLRGRNKLFEFALKNKAAL